MRQISNVVDALGNDIVIGNTYGYATSQSGRHRVTVGEAVSVTPTGRVTLKVIAVSHYLYGQPSERSWVQDASKTSVAPFILFPVSKDETNPDR